MSIWEGSIDEAGFWFWDSIHASRVPFPTKAPFSLHPFHFFIPFSNSISSAEISQGAAAHYIQRKLQLLHFSIKFWIDPKNLESLHSELLRSWLHRPHKWSLKVQEDDLVSDLDFIDYYLQSLHHYLWNRYSLRLPMVFFLGDELMKRPWRRSALNGWIWMRRRRKGGWGSKLEERERRLKKEVS